MNPASDIPVWRDKGGLPLLDASREHTDITIIGAGPVGLTLALDLGRRGHRVVVLNKLSFIAGGSKAICFSKRTLDIWGRLGVGQRIVDEGVAWNVGKVFWGNDDQPIYRFDINPVKDQRNPGFVNIQQYRVEEILLDALIELPNVEVRWGHEMVSVDTRDREPVIGVRCGDGSYDLPASWVAACDGWRSPMRSLLGLDFDGREFEDNFLIADVRFEQERPSERWFWFNAPFNPGRSALMHKQPAGIWRLDFQLGRNIDRNRCLDPRFVDSLVRGMLGNSVEFTHEWYSIYTFQCRRMDRFLHGRVAFLGDAAHVVSPFGARGCNGGIADADNFAWKLDLVLRGEAPCQLLETYNQEATGAADENISVSTRSTDFMAPKSKMGGVLRDAVLNLARSHEFARPFVNSGRLSTAVSYRTSPLSTPDTELWAQGVAPGSPALDAPTRDGWLLERLGGRPVLLTNRVKLSTTASIEQIDLHQLGDPSGLIEARYGLQRGAAYLIRPDQYVAARWKDLSNADVYGALRRAIGI